MKTFRWNSTSQTVTPIESNAIPVYDTKQDAEDDLNNLEVGQLVATADADSSSGSITELTPTISLTTGTVPNIGSWAKYGKVVHFVLDTSSTYLPDGGTFTLPFKPAIEDSFPTWWGSTFFGWIDLRTNGTVIKVGGTNATLYSSFTYITSD